MKPLNKQKANGLHADPMLLGGGQAGGTSAERAELMLAQQTERQRQHTRYLSCML